LSAYCRRSVGPFGCRRRRARTRARNGGTSRAKRRRRAPRACARARRRRRRNGPTDRRQYADRTSSGRAPSRREPYVLTDPNDDNARVESLGARTTRSVVAAIPLVLVPALGLTQGGFQPDAWVWAGALAAWAAAIAVVVSPNPGALRRQWPWAAASGALLLWTLASATWSVHAAQSVLEARRTLLYAAVVLALLLLARRDASRLLVPATHIAVAALIVYALGHYLLGARRSTEFEAYLLFEPLGYANAVGIVAVLGILLAVGIAAESSARLRRGAVAATVPPLAVALLFAQSTASWLALAVGCAVTAVIGQATVRFLATLAIVTPPTAVLLWVGNYSRFAADVPTPRLSGAAVAGITVACAAAAGALAARMRLPEA